MSDWQRREKTGGGSLVSSAKFLQRPFKVDQSSFPLIYDDEVPSKTDSNEWSYVSTAINVSFQC